MTTIEWSGFAAKQELKIQDPRPNNILFTMDHGQTEVFRISKEGIWASPDIPADEAAKKVIEALDVYISAMVERVRLEEREACAKVCDDVAAQDGLTKEQRLALHVAADAIRAREKS